MRLSLGVGGGSVQCGGGGRGPVQLGQGQGPVQCWGRGAVQCRSQTRPSPVLPTTANYGMAIGLLCPQSD